MRLHRVLVPLAAAIVLLGVFVALGIALNRRPGGSSASQPLSTSEVAELLAIKSEAEALAIADRLPEAHAKYRELFTRAQGREIKDPAFWDLIERAQIDQDRIYVILLAQHDPMRVLTPPLPATTAAAAGTTAPATTQSFVDTHPPYPGVKAAPSSVPPATRTAATTPASARASAVLAAAFPEPKHLKITQTPMEPSGFSDASVGQALAEGSEFLMAQFKNGEVQQGKEYSETYRQGLNALCVYALLHSGEAMRDPRLAPTSEFMRQALEAMKLHPMATDTSKAQQPVVYARSLRAAVLARANRPEDRDLLKDDVQWLIAAAVDGAYTYDDRFTVKVIKADPRGVGRGTRENPPLPVFPNTAKPKTLGPTKSDQPGGGAAPAPPQGAQPAGGPAAQLWRGANEILAMESPPEGPLPIQLADGMHDPKTGRELGKIPRFPPIYLLPPGTQLPPNYPQRVRPPPIYPPQELPEKYGGPFIWDNSNSQYGLLGVWAGAEVGIEVPDAYWASVEKHWLSCQLARGEWPYRKDMPGGRLAMTAAGIASLLVTHDYLEAPSVARVGRQPSPTTEALAKGFAWLEQGDNAIDVTGPRTVYLGYTLHALSRVGLASGYKYLGANDWYRVLARKVVQSQWENGAWGRNDESSADTLIDTAYTMLFLSRGRHPILMNKLRLDSPAGKNDRGEWNNRPRDLPNLARFASRELERPLNWQIVSIDRDPASWSDAPILYLASHAALRFSDQEIAKIRTFVDAGGMLFTQADNSSDSFNLYVNQLAKRLFPDGELKDLSSDDELYSLQYILPKPNRPRLRALGNGSRLLWVHSPTDLAVHWQQRAEKTQRYAFEMGVNLFVYAAGKADLRNRLEDRAIPAPTFPASATFAVARLKYPGGNWDPEPAAWPRFSRHLQWQTSIGLKPVIFDLAAADAALRAQEFPIAHLTGTSGFTPTDAQLKLLSDYVTAGGTLIVEAVGGADSAFSDSLQSTILPRAFPDARFESIPPADPMLHATFNGMEDVWPPRLRTYAVQRLGKEVPPIRSATVGKGRVIYLPLDATTGLLGAGTWPIFGYEANEAQALMKNIVLWTMEQRLAP